MINKINFVYWERELEKTTVPLDVDFLQRAKKVLNSGNGPESDLKARMVQRRSGMGH